MSYPKKVWRSGLHTFSFGNVDRSGCVWFNPKRQIVNSIQSEGGDMFHGPDKVFAIIVACVATLMGFGFLLMLLVPLQDKINDWKKRRASAGGTSDV